jgi:hypothetical protein
MRPAQVGLSTRPRQPNVAYRVATDEVLITTDGGRTWETSVSEFEGGKIGWNTYPTSRP